MNFSFIMEALLQLSPGLSEGPGKTSKLMHLEIVSTQRAGLALKTKFETEIDLSTARIQELKNKMNITSELFISVLIFHKAA